MCISVSVTLVFFRVMTWFHPDSPMISAKFLPGTWYISPIQSNPLSFPIATTDSGSANTSKIPWYNTWVDKKLWVPEKIDGSFEDHYKGKYSTFFGEKKNRPPQNRHMSEQEHQHHLQTVILEGSVAARKARKNSTQMRCDQGVVVRCQKNDMGPDIQVEVDG